MAKLLTWMAQMTRLIAVFAVLSGFGMPASGASASVEAVSAPGIGTSLDHTAADSHDGHHHDTADHAPPSHDHGSGDDCGIHCVSSLPQIAVPQISLPVILNVAYASSSQGISGRSVAMLERPPRI